MEYLDIKAKFRELFEGKLKDNKAKEFLIWLYEKRESSDDIVAGAEVMREFMVELPIPKELEGKVIDNCGTGGDNSGSFNISTTVSFILASLGCYVAKHGNRSITSKSGSADVLESLGMNLNLDIEQSSKLLSESNFTFIFAINHHLAMKHIMPIRKSIPHRTIFNILGPLSNPANVKRQLVGVFSKYYVPKIAKALRKLGSNRAVVVSSKDGLDEVSISDISYISELKDFEISNYELNPEEFGFKLTPIEAIKGGDSRVNAKILLDILEDRERGAKRDIILLNSALTLKMSDLARDIQEGIEMARDAIESKRAIAKLKEIVDISNRL